MEGAHTPSYTPFPKKMGVEKVLVRAHHSDIGHHYESTQVLDIVSDTFCNLKVLFAATARTRHAGKGTQGKIWTPCCLA